jgi:tRNA threonylcarbamoyladenosine biosynthesis protein TsaB
MIVLALDTTGRAGSAALLSGSQVVAESSADPAINHAARLPGELIDVIARAGMAPADIDLLAVAAGPGSFTGLRVGIATMQGLAMALSKPIVPVSTLDALAAVAAAEPGTLVAAWVDAQRDEVFAAIYEAGSAAPIAEATALPPLETLAAVAAIAAGRRIRFIGDGAVRYADRIAAALGAQADIALAPPRLAGAIGRIAAAAPHRAVAPHAVAPLYVRRPDVELARDRRARQA